MPSPAKLIVIETKIVLTAYDRRVLYATKNGLPAGTTIDTCPELSVADAVQWPKKAVVLSPHEDQPGSLETFGTGSGGYERFIRELKDRVLRP